MVSKRLSRPLPSTASALIVPEKVSTRGARDDDTPAACGMSFERQAAHSALLYVPLPFLLWGAVRFGTHGATASISAVAFLAILGVANGHGPFSEKSAEENALSVQVFLIFLSVPLLFLAATPKDRPAANS